MIVASVVVDKLAILHLLEQAERARNNCRALVIMPDGSTYTDANVYVDGFPERATFHVWRLTAMEQVDVECERAELVARGRRAFVYHVADLTQASDWTRGESIAFQSHGATGEPRSRLPVVGATDESATERVRREWREGATPAVRSSRDLEVARGRFVEVLTNLGMEEAEAERVSERAAAKNPTMLVKRFAPEAYYETMIDGPGALDVGVPEVFERGPASRVLGTANTPAEFIALTSEDESEGR